MISMDRLNLSRQNHFHLITAPTQLVSVSWTKQLHHADFQEDQHHSQSCVGLGSRLTIKNVRYYSSSKVTGIPVHSLNNLTCSQRMCFHSDTVTGMVGQGYHQPSAIHLSKQDMSFPPPRPLHIQYPGHLQPCVEHRAQAVCFCFCPNKQVYRAA